MPDFRLSRRADRDLRDIYQYTAEDFGLLQADRYLSDLWDCFRQLADNPQIGRGAGFLRKGYFRHERGRHVVFYTLAKRSITVVRVLHQNMDPTRHLS